MFPNHFRFARSFINPATNSFLFFILFMIFIDLFKVLEHVHRIFQNVANVSKPLCYFVRDHLLPLSIRPDFCLNQRFCLAGRPDASLWVILSYSLQNPIHFNPFRHPSNTNLFWVSVNHDRNFIYIVWQLQLPKINFGSSLKLSCQNFLKLLELFRSYLWKFPNFPEPDISRFSTFCNKWNIDRWRMRGGAVLIFTLNIRLPFGPVAGFFSSLPFLLEDFNSHQFHTLKIIGPIFGTIIFRFNCTVFYQFHPKFCFFTQSIDLFSIFFKYQNNSLFFHFSKIDCFAVRLIERNTKSSPSRCLTEKSAKNRKISSPSWKFHSPFPTPFLFFLKLDISVIVQTAFERNSSTFQMFWCSNFRKVKILQN